MVAKNFQTERKIKTNKHTNKNLRPENSACSDSVSALIIEEINIHKKDLRLGLPFQTAETTQKFFSSKEVGDELPQTSLQKLQLQQDILNGCGNVIPIVPCLLHKFVLCVNESLHKMHV